MDLGSEIGNEVKRMRKRSGLDPVMEKLSPEDQRALVEAILDPEVPLQAISAVMQKRGLHLSTHSIRRARRGEIHCGPE